MFVHSQFSSILPILLFTSSTLKYLTHFSTVMLTSLSFMVTLLFRQIRTKLYEYKTINIQTDHFPLSYFLLSIYAFPYKE